MTTTEPTATVTNGLADLWCSERGIICVLLILAGTALVIWGRLTGDQWVTFAKWIALTYVAGKTVTGAVDRLAPQPAESVP